MFPLFRKNLLFPPSGCSSLSSQVSTLRTLLIRFPVHEFSSSSSSSHPQPPCKQLEKEKVRVSVWWNFDNCRVPSGFSVWKIAPSIMRTVRANGIKASIIDIRAYGDASQFSTFQRIALFLTGIHLRHIAPGSGMGTAGWDLIEDLFSWCLNNPPPIHLFVISGDSDDDSYVMECLHKFRMMNYNILVACPRAHVLNAATAATILWEWSSILKGEDLTGKHFNCPPDGPVDSWYEDSKVPLESPFSALEEPTYSQNAEIHKPCSDIKLGEVPKSV